MANERAWGEALKSIAPYIMQYGQNRQKAEEDKRIADAILAKEERDRAEQIAREQRVSGMSSLAEHLRGRTPMMEATPAVPYTGPFDQPMPETSYAPRIVSPAQPERPLTSPELPSYYQGMFGGTPMPGTFAGEREAKPATEGQKMSSELGYARLAQQAQRMKTQQSARADTKLNSLIRQRQNMSSPYANYTDEARSQMDATIKSYMVESGIKLADMPRPEEVDTPEESSWLSTLWSAATGAFKKPAQAKAPTKGGSKTGNDVANSLGF